MNKELSTEAKQVLAHYAGLRLGGKSVPTPYYINDDFSFPSYPTLGYEVKEIELSYRRKRTKRRVLIGKGSPSEIEEYTIGLAKLEDFDLEESTVVRIREWMREHEIGVDCSGFVTWILNQECLKKLHKPIWQCLQYNSPNFIRRLTTTLRPVENTSVKVLTANSLRVNKITDIQAGDLIITWGGEHVMLIVDVEVEDSNPKAFRFAHSNWWYGEENGVRFGKVLITQPDGYLLDQKWEDPGGVNWWYEGIKRAPELSSIRRLMCLHGR